MFKLPHPPDIHPPQTHAHSYISFWGQVWGKASTVCGMRGAAALVDDELGKWVSMDQWGEIRERKMDGGGKERKPENKDQEYVL